MTIIMTGATSGIGLVAARRMIEMGAALAVGARRPENAPTDLCERARLLPLDLADLASVERFAEAARSEAITALVLNAGLQTLRRETSAQGFELTFAANHLAHFLLIVRLLRRLGPNARVILTSSGTHDPALKTGMPPPLDADAGRLARANTSAEAAARPSFAGRRAYSSSKLANLMTSRELAVRLAEARPDVAVMAFDPGFTPGTGLARAYPAPLGFVFRRIMPLVMRGAFVSTPAISGRALADLITAPVYGAARGAYFSVRDKALTSAEPSLLARDADACARLWGESAALLRQAGHPVD